MFKIGDRVRVVKTHPLRGNDVAPTLKMGDEKEVLDICLDSKGYQHLDVGLKSSLNFVRSHETGEELERGKEIHWCHPSRFEFV